jgi:hypothetical protein
MNEKIDCIFRPQNKPQKNQTIPLIIVWTGTIYEGLSSEWREAVEWRHILRSHLAAAAAAASKERPRHLKHRETGATIIPEIHAAGQRYTDRLCRRCNGERVRKTVRALEWRPTVRRFWLADLSRSVIVFRLKAIRHPIRQTQRRCSNAKKRDSPFACVLFLSIVARALVGTFRFILSYELLLMTSQIHTHTRMQHTFGLYPCDESRRCLIVSWTTAACGSRVEK